MPHLLGVFGAARGAGGEGTPPALVTESEPSQGNGAALQAKQATNRRERVNRRQGPGREDNRTPKEKPTHRQHREVSGCRCEMCQEERKKKILLSISVTLESTRFHSTRIQWSSPGQRYHRTANASQPQKFLPQRQKGHPDHRLVLHIHSAVILICRSHVPHVLTAGNRSVVVTNAGDEPLPQNPRGFVDRTEPADL